MRRRRLAPIALLALTSCGGQFGAVYPPRPSPSEGPPLADPPPSRVVAHLAVSSAAMRSQLEANVPRGGDGTFPFLGTERRYEWDRAPFDVAFSQGRIVLTTKVQARIAVPLHPLEFPVDLRVEAEPIVSSEYAVKMQSVDVKVTSSDTRLAVADRVAGVYEKIREPIYEKVRAFTYDLRPLLGQAAARIASPITLPVGDATACAQLKVLGIEMGPTVLADGIEKDLGVVVAPSVTLPCDTAETEPSAQLPPLSNVASIASGPFTVTVPIAARYDELTKAMTATFTDGKLFFSTEYPELYLEKPELYESQGALVLKLHLTGPIHKPFDTSLDGDLFLFGHPAVVDNELTLPDLEPTIETKSFLLSIKAMMDGDKIRDQARAALRLDIGARLKPVRDKLSSELTFGGADACFHGDVDRVVVTGVHPHAAYLRVYVDVTARARASMPCPETTSAPTAPSAANTN